MGDLTLDFSRREFACPCGCGFAAPAPELVTSLQELRTFIDRPIHVLSGCRCAAHNAEVGGAADSRHLTGEAADIQVDGLPLTRLFLRAAGMHRFFAGGLGIYPEKRFIHADVRDGKARWGYLGGRYVAFGDAWEAAKKMEGAA